MKLRKMDKERWTYYSIRIRVRTKERLDKLAAELKNTYHNIRNMDDVLNFLIDMYYDAYHLASKLEVR